MRLREGRFRELCALGAAQPQSSPLLNYTGSVNSWMCKTGLESCFGTLFPPALTAASATTPAGAPASPPRSPATPTSPRRRCTPPPDSPVTRRTRRSLRQESMRPSQFVSSTRNLLQQALFAGAQPHYAVDCIRSAVGGGVEVANLQLPQ